MKHVDSTITFSRRFKSLGRIDTELACQVNQSEQYWISLLQRLVSVIKFIADRGLAFRADDENVGSPRSTNVGSPRSTLSKREDAVLLVTGFVTVSQIANHCQISC